MLRSIRKVNYRCYDLNEWMLNMVRDMHDNGFWDDNECFCIMCQCLLGKMSIHVRKYDMKNVMLKIWACIKCDDWSIHAML